MNESNNLEKKKGKIEA